MEKPILFSTPMVQAILDGRKTKTRRIVDKDISNQFDVDVDSTVIAYMDQSTGDSHSPIEACKYKVGDILWVRETWRIGAWNEDLGAIAVDYKANNFPRKEWLTIDDEKQFEKYWIQSTEDCEKAGLIVDSDGKYNWNVGEAPTRWRPSIFMPRAAARIFLRVTDVRVERLQDITEDDAVKEGVKAYGQNNCSGTSARIAFAELWDKLNEKRGFGWRTKPWVWVIEFERIEGEA